MRLDVYPTDAEAFEAAAGRVAEVLRAAPGDRPLSVALSGGRGGRGVMGALAARTDLPWDRIDWYWADERCVPVTDPRSNIRLARETLFVPRGIAASRNHPPPVDLADPARIASAYAELLRAALGGPTPVFTVVLLGMGKDGHFASVTPGSPALDARDAVVAVAAEQVTEEPHVARITLTPVVIQAAQHVLVTVTGDAKADIVERALQGPFDPQHVPAHLVRPSATVEWIVDRAAAAGLLRDARQAADGD